MEGTDNQPTVWSSVKRGAMLGIYVAIAIYLVMVPILIYAAMTSPSAREDILGTDRPLLLHIGGAIGGFCLMASYLAVAGGVIMGAIGLVRSRRRH